MLGALLLAVAVDGPAQDAAPAAPPAPPAAAPPSEPAAPQPTAPGDGAPSAVEAAKGGEAPAASEPAPAPVATMPDPLVSPLEDPPVPTDLLTEGAPPTPTESVVVNLINRLVERGVLTQGDAAELVSQAQRDAAIAAQNAAAAALVAADAAMASEEDIVVTHIPEPVKERLREEIKQELASELPQNVGVAFVEHEELPQAGLPPQSPLDAPVGFDFPGTKAVVGELVEIPGWVRRTQVFGDVRMRYDSTRFGDENDNTGSFPNFNRINTGEPFDVAGFEFSPQFNVDEDRQRFRLRARVGFHTDIGNGFMVGFRGVTGNDNRGVSVNQTLTGNFPKYEFWLDQAFVRWDGAIGSVPGTFSIGRFENPFFHTSDVLWDRDLMFDGAVAGISPEISERLRAHFTAGAFPLYNTPFNGPDNQPDKFDSQDRYLYGTEAGLSFNMNRNVAGRFGIGYHDFDNVEGELSDPYVPLTPRDAGSTDDLRPPFAQKGNTYMALRNITPDPLNNFGTANQFQYFGLATPFQIVNYNARFDLHHWEPYQISLLGEYAMNVGFDEDRLNALAVNNRGPVKPDGSPGDYEGGNIAWNVAVQFGKPVLERLGDWHTNIGYRYIESDAVVDGFNVSDFGLGGTNMEGFTVGTTVAITDRVNFELRWMSASEIVGPPLRSDIFFFDFNTSF